MGIVGLLQFLKPIILPASVKVFKGCTVGVDVLCWYVGVSVVTPLPGPSVCVRRLHKGIYTCAQDLAQGKDTEAYVNFCMQRIRTMQQHGVEPYIVFDGGRLPAKRGTETARAK